MRNGRRIGLLIAVAGLVAGVVLGLIPLSYTTPGGLQKGEFFVSQKVDCGIGLWPEWPPPPPGADDECDGVHFKMWSAMILVAGPAVLLGGLVAFGPALVRRATKKSAVKDLGNLE